MEFRRLGRTGLKVSPICLGTMTFGVQCDETQSRAILDRAADGASRSSTPPTATHSSAIRRRSA